MLKDSFVSWARSGRGREHSEPEACKCKCLTSTRIFDYATPTSPFPPSPHTHTHTHWHCKCFLCKLGGKRCGKLPLQTLLDGIAAANARFARGCN